MTLVNPKVLKALTDAEVLEKAGQYEVAGNHEGSERLINIADVYWKEHVRRINL